MRRLAVISSVLLPQPPKLLSPSVGQLALSGVAPIIRLPINPGSASLSLSGVVPTLGISPGFSPSAGALTLAATTPVLSIASGLTLTPTVGSLILSAATPVASLGLTLTPTVASLTATGVAPTATVATPFLPSQLGNLVGWYDASDVASLTDDGSGKASQWNDKSSNANHFTQATSGSRPTITASGINSLGTLTFAGSQSMAKASGAAGLPDNSAGYIVGTVALETSTGAYFYFVGTPGLADAITLETDSNWFFVDNNGTLIANQHIAALGTGANVLSCSLGNSSDTNVYLNGTIGDANQNANYSHNYTGNTNSGTGNNLHGQIGEIVVASGTLTADRQKIEGYLAWKWGLQGSLPGGHPYKSVAP